MFPHGLVMWLPWSEYEKTEEAGRRDFLLDGTPFTRRDGHPAAAGKFQVPKHFSCLDQIFDHPAPCSSLPLIPLEVKGSNSLHSSYFASVVPIREPCSTWLNRLPSAENLVVCKGKDDGFFSSESGSYLTYLSHAVHVCAGDKVRLIWGGDNST